MTVAELPAPLVPPWVDLRCYDWFHFYHKRLRQSAFWKSASDLACRISVDFWSEAYEQVPAGSIPNNDHILSEWAGFGRRDLSGWLAARDEVLSAWTLCSDGRWYHPTLSEVACQAGVERRKHLWVRECDRIRKENLRRQKAELPALALPPKPSDDPWQGGGLPETSGGEMAPSDGHPEDVPQLSAGRPPEPLENPPENALRGRGRISPSDKSSGEGAQARRPARSASAPPDPSGKAAGTPQRDPGQADPGSGQPASGSHAGGSPTGAVVPFPAAKPPPRRPKRTEMLWPDDLAMTEADQSFAAERGYVGPPATRLWEAFENRAKARALRYADWHAAWRTFVLKQLEFDGRTGTARPPFGARTAYGGIRTERPPI